MILALPLPPRLKLEIEIGYLLEYSLSETGGSYGEKIEKEH